MNVTEASNAGAELAQALHGFLAAYEAQPALVDEQRGWNAVITLQATDAPARIAVALADGRVAGVGEAARSTLEIAADLRTLCDVLDRRRDPNEPYLFGELVVTGPEADFVRLDYIAGRLCAR